MAGRGPGSDAGPPPNRGSRADLCATYWYPLYASLRREGHPPDRARALLLGFVAGPACGDPPGTGKARVDLPAALRDHAARAPGEALGPTAIPIDLDDAEARYAREPPDGPGAGRHFGRRWALTLLGTVLDRLAAEWAADGAGPTFDRLRPALLGAGRGAGIAGIARELAVGEPEVEAAARRLRRRFRELVREEVARTIDDAGAVDDEIRELIAALG